MIKLSSDELLKIADDYTKLIPQYASETLISRLAEEVRRLQKIEVAAKRLIDDTGSGGREYFIPDKTYLALEALCDT